MNILEEINKVLQKKGIKKTVTPTVHFKDLGLDSLDLMDVVIDLEQLLGISFPDDKLLDITTAQSFIDIVNELKK